MSSWYESVIVPLIGTPNGVLKQFATPSAYLSGSIRVFLNGQLVDPTDNLWGWTEISDSVIEFTNAPETGDVLETFYQELSPVPGINNFVASPFHPTGDYT
jgi:hypothetical protein